MEEDSVQSIQLTESEKSDYVLNYNEEDSLDLKIKSIQNDFDKRFADREKGQMNLEKNFFRNYYILGLLNKVKSIEDSLDQGQKDRVSIEMLFDLYSSQLIELDNRFQNYVESLGEWSGHVLDQFIDGGYSMFKRFFVYKMLGHQKSITDNPAVKNTYNRVFLLRSAFAILCIFCAVLFVIAGSKIKSPFLGFGVKLLLSLHIFVSIALFIYAPGINYWIRSILQKFIHYDEETVAQVDFRVAEMNELCADINSMREEIGHHIGKIFQMSNDFKLQSNYDSYVTFGEVKRALLNIKTIKPEQQDVIFYIINPQNLLLLVKDYGFVYWVLRRHFKSIFVLFVAILTTFFISYSALILSKAPAFWQEVTAVIAAGEIAEALNIK